MVEKWKKILLILLGLWVLGQYAVAQVERSSTEEDDGEPAFSAGREVSGGGLFEGSGTKESEEILLRDPFWPVGFVPPTVKEAASPGAQESEGSGPVDFHGLTPEEQALIKSRMSVGGILKQNSGCIAIINNQLLKEGDPLRIRAGNRDYEFLITALTTERVLLEAKKDR